MATSEAAEPSDALVGVGVELLGLVASSFIQ